MVVLLLLSLTLGASTLCRSKVVSPGHTFSLPSASFYLHLSPLLSNERMTATRINDQRKHGKRPRPLQKASDAPLPLRLFLVVLSFQQTQSLSPLPLSRRPSSYIKGLSASSTFLHMVVPTRPSSLSLSSTSSSSTSRDTKRTTTTTTATTTQNPAKIERTIVQLGRSGKTDEALSLYETLDRPTVRLMNGVIDACARARPTRLDTAFDIFENHVQVMDKTKVGGKGSGRGGGSSRKHDDDDDRSRSSSTTFLQPNVFTFGALMNACNRARDGHRAVKLLRSMEEMYGVVPNEVVFSSAISACARSQPPQSKQALKLLKEAVEERRLAMSVVGFNACISACAQASDWENAISLVTRMEEASLRNTTDSSLTFTVPEPDAVTYGTVMAACERGGQWRTVLKYAQSMQDRGLLLDGLAMTSCLHACAELGLASNALRYLDLMKSVDPVAPQTAKLERYGAKQPLSGPDAVAYRCAITACARGGAWEEGIRLLDECKSVTGTPANVVAYTAAITGCEYAGKWKEAFYLLDKMRKEGVEPNEMTMVAVIGACATACAKSEVWLGHQGAANAVPAPQHKALQLLNVLKKDPDTVKPNIQIYNACIRTCAEARDVERAFQLLDEATALDLDKTQVTYGSLMTACERVGDVQSSSIAFRKMEEDGITANEVIYGAAISCCRKANEPQRALWLLKKMIQEELSPNAATINTAMIAQTDARRKGDSDRVLQLYKLMHSKYVAQNGRPNRQTYNILVNFFAATMQPAIAERFIDKMRESGFKPDVDLFTATVSAYERTQQPLKAVKIMKRMEEDGYDFYSVNVLNSAFKKAIKLVNAVGQTFASPEEDKSFEYTDFDDGQESDDFV